MPISEIDGCTEEHWLDVLGIISQAVENAGFAPNIVSNSDDVGVIQKNIIQNLYDNPIVVCDVSGKNPNVMFELGMRLAFDKPTIIIKDNKTPFSFDTSPIEHLQYPRDLRFTKIVDFTNALSSKISATYERSCKDTSYTPFLKHFGSFKVAKIDEKEVSGQEFIIEELRALRTAMHRVELGQLPRRDYASSGVTGREGVVEACLRGISDSDIKIITDKICGLPGVESINVQERGPNHKHMEVILKDDADFTAIRRSVTKYKRMFMTSERIRTDN